MTTVLRPALVQQALRLYEALLDKTCADPVRAHIAQLAAVIDAMSPREQATYYAGAQRVRLARRGQQEA
jgi:hypothetical protein